MYKTMLLKTTVISVIAAVMLGLVSPVIIEAQPTGPNTDHSTSVSTNEVGQALAHTPGVLSASDQSKTTSDADSAIVAATAGATIDVPKDASDGVTLAANGGPSLDIQLPNADQAGDAKQVAPGVVAYSANNGSANAVQADENGGVRMLTIIDNPNAPTKYDYKVTVPNGGRIELTPDGGAVVLDADSQVLTAVGAPWAKDAKGKQISTWFVTDGQTLTQYVKHNVKGVVYPITADPWISWGWKMYVNFSKSETRYIAGRQNQAGFYYGLPGAAGCFFIGAGTLGFACGSYIAVRSAGLMDAVGRAAAMNGCLQIGISYLAYSPTMFWASYYSMSFSAIRC